MSCGCQAYAAKLTLCCISRVCFQSLQDQLHQPDLHPEPDAVPDPEPEQELEGMPAQVRVRGHGVGGRLCATTQLWFGFKFCQVRGNGEHTRWEVACYHATRVGAMLCRKHMTMGRNQSLDDVERKLKHWCLTAGQYDSRDAHVMCGPILLDGLPSLAELDVLADANAAL